MQSVPNASPALSHGILLLDKPVGVSSFAALYPVKRAFGGKKGSKIGHAGTLDPAASGLLLIGVGHGTRLLEYLEGLPKQYTFTLKLGIATDTYDLEGTVLERRDTSGVTREAIEALLPGFRGDILRAPPPDLAIKVDGQRAYALARAGETVELPARKVRVDRLELLSFAGGPNGEAEMVLDCSKGTYVRSIAHDLGKLLGVGGAAANIRRTRIGPFKVEDAIAPDALAEGVPALAPLDLGVAHFAAVEIKESWVGPLLNGNAVPASGFSPRVGAGNASDIDAAFDTPTPRPSPLRAAFAADGRLLAIGEINGLDQLQPVKVFPAR